MAPSLNHDSIILIVGCGTWGASTALWLARNGYKNVTVLDPYTLPSPISAGTDVNKIARGRSRHPPEYFTGPRAQEEWVYNEIRADATDGWDSDPVFKEFYHETGYIIAASDPANVKELYESEKPTPDRGFHEVSTPEQFRETMPKGVLTGDFPNWKGWFKAKGAGWVHAQKALVAAAMEAQRLGVKLVGGDPYGKVTELIYEKDGTDVRGARTADDKEWLADRTILCAGANAAQLFDMKDQLRPTAWTLAHIRMSPDEAASYRNLPVLFNVERGFFMEPDEDNHDLKLCNEHPGYCNWKKSSDGTVSSVPFAKQQIPLESEQEIRQFLRECMPQLAERPFSFARICWCADTPNRDFLITAHPDYPSLTLGVGDSGQGFMHITVIGKYIQQCMEGKLDERMRHTWRWRPETAVKRNWGDLQGRSGGPNTLRDLGKIPEDQWTTLAAKL